VNPSTGREEVVVGEGAQAEVRDRGADGGEEGIDPISAGILFFLHLGLAAAVRRARSLDQWLLARGRLMSWVPLAARAESPTPHG
jgi:hypothetical protein